MSSTAVVEASPAGKIPLPAYQQFKPIAPVVGGERYVARWKELDTTLVEYRQRVREVDMALNACNAAREHSDDLYDVPAARFGLEKRRRALAEYVGEVAANAALLTLLRRLDPEEQLPSVEDALRVLKAVGPSRFPQSVKVCKAIREQCATAYERHGDKRSVGQEKARALLLDAALDAFVVSEQQQMAFISMLEPCIGTAVVLSDDLEVAKRAKESGLYEPNAAVLKEEEEAAGSAEVAPPTVEDE